MRATEVWSNLAHGDFVSPVIPPTVLSLGSTVTASSEIEEFGSRRRQALRPRNPGKSQKSNPSIVVVRLIVPADPSRTPVSNGILRSPIVDF